MMNRIVLRLLTPFVTPSSKNYTCLFVSHETLRTAKLYYIRRCCRSSTTKDLSELLSCSLPDEFDFEGKSASQKIDYNAVTDGDPDKLKALKLVQLEIDMLSQHTGEVPSALSTSQWKDIVAISSVHQRKKFIRHLWLKELRQNIKRRRREENRELREKLSAAKEQQESTILTTSSPLEYGLHRFSLFHRIRDPTINRLSNFKLLQAEWFGPQIIVDCDYESFMSRKDIGKCVRQMQLMWSDNRENFNPYDILFCNVNANAVFWQKFISLFSINDETDDIPIHYTSEHYLKLFPRKKLVYLTPHCSEILEKYNHDDIYIIGAYIDTSRCEPLSLAKAKKEGLRKAKFPLDRYLHWARGSKSLYLNTVLAILNDLKIGRSWPEALKNVPMRNIVRDDYDEPVNPSFGLTAKAIRENYRQNLVYDLLLNNGFKSPPKKS